MPVGQHTNMNLDKNDDDKTITTLEITIAQRKKQKNKHKIGETDRQTDRQTGRQTEFV